MRVGDVVAGVDGALVGCDPLPRFLDPAASAHTLLLMRATAARVTPTLASPGPPSTEAAAEDAAAPPATPSVAHAAIGASTTTEVHVEAAGDARADEEARAEQAILENPEMIADACAALGSLRSRAAALLAASVPLDDELDAETDGDRTSGA